MNQNALRLAVFALCLAAAPSQALIDVTKAAPTNAPEMGGPIQTSRIPVLRVNLDGLSKAAGAVDTKVGIAVDVPGSASAETKGSQSIGMAMQNQQKAQSISSAEQIDHMSGDQAAVTGDDAMRLLRVDERRGRSDGADDYSVYVSRRRALESRLASYRVDAKTILFKLDRPGLSISLEQGPYGGPSSDSVELRKFSLSYDPSQFLPGSLIRRTFGSLPLSFSKEDIRVRSQSYLIGMGDDGVQLDIYLKGPPGAKDREEDGPLLMISRDTGRVRFFPADYDSDNFGLRSVASGVWTETQQVLSRRSHVGVWSAQGEETAVPKSSALLSAGKTGLAKWIAAALALLPTAAMAASTGDATHVAHLVISGALLVIGVAAIFVVTGAIIGSLMGRKEFGGFGALVGAIIGAAFGGTIGVPLGYLAALIFGFLAT